MVSEEIQVGEYVRLDRNQGINKIIGIDEDGWYELDSDYYDEYGDWRCSIRKYELERDMIKHSPDIIDLIEVGDYVNGEKIITLEDGENIVTKQKTKIANKNGDFAWIIYDWVVKDIVTHEQFESIKYKVGDE